MRVAQSLILVPVFIQVALTLFVVASLWFERTRWMIKNHMKADEVALAGPDVWSEQGQKLSNNFSNLLELPVLFYVCALFALVLQMVDVWMLALAWMYVGARIVHTAIHIGPNRVMARFISILFSMVVLSAMWILLMWQVYAAS